jgi:hypothetical protein
MDNKGKRMIYAHDVMDNNEDDYNDASYEIVLLISIRLLIRYKLVLPSSLQG